MKMCQFEIGRGRRRRLWRVAGASAALAQLVVCRAHTTHRIQSVVAMPRPLLEATDRKVSFLNGYPAWWSCLLFKTSGESFFLGSDLHRVFNGNATNEIRNDPRDLHVKIFTFRSIELDVGGA